MKWAGIYQSRHGMFWYQTLDGMWRHCASGILYEFDEVNAEHGPFKLVAKEF